MFDSLGNVPDVHRHRFQKDFAIVPIHIIQNCPNIVSIVDKIDALIGMSIGVPVRSAV